MSSMNNMDEQLRAEVAALATAVTDALHRFDSDSEGRVEQLESRGANTRARKLNELRADVIDAATLFVQRAVVSAGRGEFDGPVIPPALDALEAIVRVVREEGQFTFTTAAAMNLSAALLNLGDLFNIVEYIGE